MTLLTASLHTALAAPPARDALPFERPEIEERIEGALNAANATPAQRNSVREILTEQLPYLHGLREEAASLREDLRSVFLADTIDRDAAAVLRLEAVDLFDRATESGLELMLDVASLFTAEQRAALSEWRQQHMRERFSRLSR